MVQTGMPVKEASRVMSLLVVNGPLRPPAFCRHLDDRSVALHLVGIGTLTGVLVSGDAFGSGDLPLGRQALMFGVISALLILQASICYDLGRRLRALLPLAAAPAAASAVATTWLLMTMEIELLKDTPIVPYARDPWSEFALFLMPFVVPVASLVVGLKWVSGRAGIPVPALDRPEGESVPHAPTQLPPPVPLPAKAFDDWPQNPVLRVQAADHYLQLWTTGGEVLVRGRMQDALAILTDDQGIQTHRSWWVAWSEIKCIERRARDHVLRLHNGEQVPVARARVADVTRRLASIQMTSD